MPSDSKYLCIVSCQYKSRPFAVASLFGAGAGVVAFVVADVIDAHLHSGALSLVDYGPRDSSFGDSRQAKLFNVNCHKH